MKREGNKKRGSVTETDHVNGFQMGEAHMNQIALVHSWVSTIGDR